MKPLALGIIALLLFSVVTIPLEAFALTPATFTDQPTFTSLNSDRWSKVWTDDRSQAIVFNGSSQFLTAANNSVHDITTQDFSIIGYFEATGDVQNSMLVRKRAGGSTDQGYGLFFGGSRQFGVLLAGGGVAASIIQMPGPQIASGDKYFFGASFDRDNQVLLMLYNPATATLTTHTGDISAQSGTLTNTQTFTIARHSATASAFLSAIVDDINIIDGTAITQAQFLEFVTIGGLSSVTPTSIYDFNAGNANDIIGNNHLTMNGAPTFTSDVADISPITGTYFLDVQENGAALDFKSVLVSPWGSIHKTNSVSHSVAQTISANSPGMSDVQIDSSTGVRSVYIAGMDGQSTPVVYAAHVNIDTAAVINSASQSTTNVVSSGRIAVSVANRVYVDYGHSTGTNSVSFATDLTGGAFHSPGGATRNTGDVVSTIKTFGATQADDERYILTTHSSLGTQISKFTANTTTTSLGSITGNSATGMALTDTNSLTIGRATAGGTVRTFTIEKATDTLSIVLFTNTWTTLQTQLVNRFTDGTKTYQADGLAYYATPVKAASYGAINSVLADPAIRYIEDAASGTLTGIGGTFYRLSDSLVVTGPGTTWTPKVITGVHITPTPFSEPIAAPPVQNNTLFNDNVIRLACDANYLFGSHVVVGDDSDCTDWIILPTSASDVGRQIPYNRTSDLIHANPMTAYTFNIFTSTPTDIGINILYHDFLVDSNRFGDDSNAQVRLQFGNCYQTNYIQLSTGEVIQTGQFCAGDITTVQTVVNPLLGFTFWNAPWGVIHEFNDDTNVLTLTVRHKPFPYDYDIKIFNATGTVLVDQNITSNNEVNQTTHDMTAFMAQAPFEVKVFRADNGNQIYSKWFANPGLIGLLLPIFGPLGDIEFAGWGILMFLPIIFAAMFTRNTAGIGGGMLVAFIGVLVFMGIIVMEEGAIWLITVVAVFGLLMYRKLASV